MLVGLIGTELTTAAVGGFMAYRGLSGLETRLLERLADHYGHDRTSDGDFTQSLDYAQYKVKLNNLINFFITYLN